MRSQCIAVQSGSQDHWSVPLSLHTGARHRQACLALGNGDPAECELEYLPWCMLEGSVRSARGKHAGFITGRQRVLPG